MRIPFAPFIVIVLFSLLVDIYIYRVCRQRFKSRFPARLQLWSALTFYILAAVALMLPRREGDNGMLLTVMWGLYAYLSIYFSKFVFVLTDLIARIPELFGRRRARWLSALGTGGGILVFCMMWWGALVTRFQVDVNEVELTVQGLPEEFDGYRILQFSDLHTGTFGTDTTFVAELVDRMNSLDADIVVFTGDIVNRRSDELPPFVGTLGRLHAPDGVVAILGNHDYGDYADWENQQAKLKDREALRNMIGSMGWRLLLNETDTLRKGASTLALIGVENVGDPPFHTYGSLAKAYPTPDDSVCKILLTHNPAHWVDSISGHPEMNIPLTLSGHTHAMQMKLGGMSPAVFRYRTWGGLYDDSTSKDSAPAHSLYVNIGTGTVGFPARIGQALPELTLITLKRPTISKTINGQSSR